MRGIIAFLLVVIVAALIAFPLLPNLFDDVEDHFCSDEDNDDEDNME